jgi:hypothetical protein
MRERSYSMDTTDGGNDTSADNGSSDSSSDNEFVFDGFKVMFVEKVMLTPVVQAMPTAALTQAQSRRWL